MGSCYTARVTFSQTKRFPPSKGGELGDVSPTAELSALAKLTANWQSVIEGAALTPGQLEEKKVGHKQLI